MFEKKQKTGVTVEVTLINKKLITINSPTKYFKENKLNHPNGPNKDCLIWL